MGSILSPIIGDIVINDIIYSSLDKIDFEIPFIFNFVDDLILAIPIDKINNTLEIFNSYDHHLKFTIEIEEQNSIAFLDTKNINEISQIITDWYQKPNSSGRYILYNSNHPFRQKLNLIFGLKNRILKLSETKFHKKNFKILCNILQKNGYPNYLLKQVIYSTNTTHTNSSNNNNNTSQIYFTLPYIPKLSQKLSNVLKSDNIKIAFSNFKTVGNFYTKLKDKIEKMSKNNIIYSKSCKSCKKQYIGQTSQNLKWRITQHKSDIKCKPNSCALSKHVVETLHQMDFENVEILANENNLEKRLFLEMYFINKISDNLNFRKDIQNLSNIYSFLLNSCTKH